jgi:signal transduction histidine kinase
MAKVFGLVLFNVMIFIVATSEPFSTGMYLQYVTAGSVALALYGYEQWKGALLFVLLSLILNVIVFTSEVSFIPWRAVESDQANVFFVINTLIAAVVSVYAFMFYSKTNYESELALKANENIIRNQNAELLKANEELDRFVYSASHDLRSPLATLTGLINLSKLEKDDAEKLKYLDLMKERIRAMDSFISEIIDYSRNSRVEVKKEDVNA